MKKKILFFKLVLTKNPQLSLLDSQDTTLQNKIEEFIAAPKNKSDYIQVSNKKVFHISSLDTSHIFGTFGKTDDIEKGDTIRGRNRENFSVENIEPLVETFTYFYLDLNQKLIALIQKSELPDFKKPFSDFIGSHFRISGLFDIKVVPYLSEDIENRFGKKTSVSKIKVSYASNQLPTNEYASTQETLDLAKSDIQKATLTMTMKPGVTKDFKRFKSLNKNEYEDIIIENEDETIDLINGIITKKVTIEIDDDDMKNSNKIKDLLALNLPHSP